MLEIQVTIDEKHDYDLNAIRALFSCSFFFAENINKTNPYHPNRHFFFRLSLPNNLSEQLQQ